MAKMGAIWLDVARYSEDDYLQSESNPKGYRPYPALTPIATG
jgi:hypothetical protein